MDEGSQKTGAFRWWEAAASRSRLELPAALAGLPEVLFLDGETRRITVDPHLRTATVGTGWTGAVMLAELSPRLPVASAPLAALLDPALEGPLWLDVGPWATALEGAIFSWRGGARTFLERCAASGAFPAGTALDPSDTLARIEALLPEARIGGMIVGLAPEPGLWVVVQHHLESGGAPLDAVLEVARHLGIGEDSLADVRARGLGLCGAGCRWVELVVPVVARPGLALRFWNVPAVAVRRFVRAGGADDAAVERLDGLMAFARREEAARCVVAMPVGREVVAAVVLDLGLVGY